MNIFDEYGPGSKKEVKHNKEKNLNIESNNESNNKSNNESNNNSNSGNNVNIIEKK